MNLLRRKALKQLRSKRFFLDLLRAIGNSGLVGERRNAAIVYVCGTSRLLTNPLHLLVKGKSSSGKNFLVNKVSNFFPDGTFNAFTSATDASWSGHQESLKHKVLYLHERNARAGNPEHIRLLISEGKIIRNVMVREGADWITKPRITEGPVASVSTTTQEVLQIDDETRHLSIRLNESPEQTQRIYRAAFQPMEPPTPEEIEVWRDAQMILQERTGVIFKREDHLESLHEHIRRTDLAGRRILPAFLEAANVLALLRSFQEEHTGRSDTLNVNFQDIAVASLLFGPVLSESSASAEMDIVRRAVAEVHAQTGRGANSAETAKQLEVSYHKAARLLHRAVEEGVVVRANEPALGNEKRYQPAHRTFFADLGQVYSALRGVPRKLSVIHPLTGREIVFKRGLNS